MAMCSGQPHSVIVRYAQQCHEGVLGQVCVGECTSGHCEAHAGVINKKQYDSEPSSQQQKGSRTTIALRYHPNFRKAVHIARRLVPMPKFLAEEIALMPAWMNLHSSLAGSVEKLNSSLCRREYGKKVGGLCVCLSVTHLRAICTRSRSKG